MSNVQDGAFEDEEYQEIKPEVIIASINQYIVDGFDQDLDPDYMLDVLYTAIGVYMQDKSATIPLSSHIH